MDRDRMLDEVAKAVLSKALTHPVRVCIDGPPAAGKSTLADELAVVLRARGREVIRASTDGFHLPREQRYRRGEYSAEGCYHDGFDYDVLHRVLLDPLGPKGDRRFRHAVSDYRTDTALSLPVTTTPVDGVLLFDGVFLLRPELRDSWDVSIYLRVEWDEGLRRAVERDSSWMGSPDEVRKRYLARYMPGQRLYHDEASPEEAADIVIDNSNLEEPEMIRNWVLGEGG